MNAAPALLVHDERMLVTEILATYLFIHVVSFCMASMLLFLPPLRCSVCTMVSGILVARVHVTVSTT